MGLNYSKLGDNFLTVKRRTMDKTAFTNCEIFTGLLKSEIRLSSGLI